jgi:hypothetical protein
MATFAKSCRRESERPAAAGRDSVSPEDREFHMAARNGCARLNSASAFWSKGRLSVKGRWGQKLSASSSIMPIPITSTASAIGS